MNDLSLEDYRNIVDEVKAHLKREQIVLLAEYVREYNQEQEQNHEEHRLAFSTAAQACREGRIPAILIGSNHWLVPRGAIEAAREAGLLTGKRGRPIRRTITG